MSDPLQEALKALKIAVVRRLVERLEDPKETATPAYLDVARKVITDLERPETAPRAPAVTRDLPFPAPEDE